MNIKNIKTYILSAILTLSFTSCLDKYPEDSIRMDEAINTVSDVDKLVYGIYDGFKSSSLYSGSLTLLPDLQTDFVYCVKGYSNTALLTGLGRAQLASGQTAAAETSLTPT